MVEACKCAVATFHYTGDTKTLREMAIERKVFQGYLLADRVMRNLKIMRENCGIDIEDTSIEHAETIGEIFKGKEPYESLTLEESEHLERLLFRIEDDVVPKLVKCALEVD